MLAQVSLFTSICGSLTLLWSGVSWIYSQTLFRFRGTWKGNTLLLHFFTFSGETRTTLSLLNKVSTVAGHARVQRGRGKESLMVSPMHKCLRSWNFIELDGPLPRSQAFTGGFYSDGDKSILRSTLPFKCNIIFPSTLSSLNWSFLQVFPLRFCKHARSIPSCLILLDFITTIFIVEHVCRI
jgi:hypothetical protein